MNVIAAFLPHLTATAERGKPADLINTSSIAATCILEKFSIYSGTKAYISHLTRLIRVELGRKNVRVSAIEPGMVDTELPDHVTDPDASALMAGLLHDIECLRGVCSGQRKPASGAPRAKSRLASPLLAPHQSPPGVLVAQGPQGAGQLGGWKEYRPSVDVVAYERGDPGGCPRHGPSSRGRRPRRGAPAGRLPQRPQGFPLYGIGRPDRSDRLIGSGRRFPAPIPRPRGNTSDTDRPA
jgi:hypothetical protein